jgi:nitrogen fixation/metabolism regulation signal transduction histidine kinase
MNWFLNFSTRNKLVVGFGAMFAFLVWVTATAYVSISAIQESQHRLYQEEFVNAVDLMKLRSNENGVRVAILEMMLVTQRSDQVAWHQDIKERSKEITEITQRLLVRNRSNPRMSGKLKDLNGIREVFAQTRDTEIIPLIYSGKMKQAKALILGIQKERYVQIRTIAQELGDAAEEEARTAVADSEREVRQAVRLFIIAGAMALLLGVGLTVLLSRIIALPLKAISDIAERVAAGDLTVNVPESKRDDEVGVLMHTFRAMVENLRQTTREINEGVSVLASSSSEILATTTQVASGAAETASAVSETTATMEEVKQTAQVSSQKARFV